MKNILRFSSALVFKWLKNPFTACISGFCLHIHCYTFIPTWMPLPSNWLDSLGWHNILPNNNFGPSKSRYSATSAAGVQGHLFELPVLPLIFSRCQRATQRIPRPLRSPSCQQLDLCTSLMLRDAEETRLEIDRFYLKFLSYRNGINLMCWTVVPSILLTNQSDSIADCAPVVGGDILLLNVMYHTFHTYR